MRKATALLLIFTLAAALTGCGSSASDGVRLQKYSDYVFEAFDTVISVTAYCQSEEEFERLMDTVREDFVRYHRLYDIYFTYPGMNNLRSVNESAGIAPVEVGEELLDLIEFSLDMYRRAQGRVNIAMGSVLGIWHAAREYNNAVPEDSAYLPDMETLRAAAEHCDIENVIIDRASGTVFLADAAMSLDVGALAKGYATERVAQHLLEEGYEHFVINAGGNVRCCGTKPGGEDWNVAVTNPGLPDYGESLGTVSVPGGSIVTSGSYQRFFAYEGTRYHHIIDPDTLMPENRYLSVTVITEDSGLADALSTCLFNMDIDEGRELISALGGVEAMWVLPDGEELFTEGFVLK